MNAELLILKFIKLLPDGKYTLPIDLTVDKLGSSAILKVKFSLNESEMLSMPEGDTEEPIDNVLSD